MIPSSIRLELAAASAGGNWNLPLVLAGISALTAVASAIIAGRFAKAARKSEIEAQYIRDLENRISEKKYDVYKPMIDALKNIMNLQRMTANEFRDRTSEFATWISIFGSDEAVKAFHDFMQASYHAAPPAVLMKLYADFVISARRDMGYPNTEIKQSHFVGIRISDLYDNNILKDINKPLADICREAQWTPPWPHAEA